MTVRTSILALSSAAALAVTFAPSAAHAINCDPTTLTCSVNDSRLEALRLQDTERLPTGIDTGWIPKCSSNGPHCDKRIQVRAQLAFDPPGGNGTMNKPVYVVDMTKGTNVAVTWPTDQEFEISLVPNTSTDAQFTVAHSLTPEFGIWLGKLIGISVNSEFNINATDLVNLIPGAQFNYLAQKTQTFSPWGFDGVTAKVKGTDWENSQLFSITFQQLGEFVGIGTGFTGFIDGKFSFNASTDSDFTYKTKQVDVIGATGPITEATGVTKIPMNDGDFLEFNVQPKGTLSYKGQIDLLPVISITKVASIGVTVDFPIKVGLDFQYDSNEFDVQFPAQIVHVPLPNVFVPSNLIDFGQIRAGDRAEKTKTIDNTGEMGATLEFESSDSQFAISTTSTQMGPASDYELKIRFTPKFKGKQQATITIKSNDPDSPVQTFEVFGFGEGEDLPDNPGAGGSSGGGTSAPPASAAEDSGCGCRTAGGDNSNAAWLALVGAAAIGLRRRRRRG